MAGYGSYYEFSPHQVYAGYGAFGSVAQDFNANQVWADVQLGGSCYTPGNANYTACQAEPQACGKCNYAGGKATNMIRAALNELGYGPLTMGNVPWGEGNPGAAWKRFLSDHNMAPGPGLGVSLDGLILMEKLLKEGAKPGPGAAQEYEKKNGTFIPVTNGESKAGITSGTLLLAALVVGGIGYAAYKVGQKKKGGGSSRAMTLR